MQESLPYASLSVNRRSPYTLADGVPRPQALFPAPRLRELRLARLLSQERLAKQAGVARESIINLEAGGVARAETIRKLAEALRVATADLMSPEARES